MTNGTFSIKQNDTRPKLVVTLYDKYGEEGQAPIDLTEAEEVNFVMRNTEKEDPEAPDVKGTCTITDAVNGVVTYTWAAADTDTVGTYNIEFEIKWKDGGVETVPNKGYAQISVVDDLG